MDGVDKNMFSLPHNELRTPKAAPCLISCILSGIICTRVACHAACVCVVFVKHVRLSTGLRYSGCTLAVLCCYGNSCSSHLPPAGTQQQIVDVCTLLLAVYLLLTCSPAPCWHTTDKTCLPATNGEIL